MTTFVRVTSLPGTVNRVDLLTPVPWYSVHWRPVLESVYQREGQIEVDPGPRSLWNVGVRIERGHNRLKVPSVGPKRRKELILRRGLKDGDLKQCRGRKGGRGCQQEGGHPLGFLSEGVRQSSP